MRTWDDEKSVIYLLLLLVQHGQNNYFFGRTKLEKIRYNLRNGIEIANPCILPITVGTLSTKVEL